MKNRPLCCMCLLFVFVQIVIFLARGGQENIVPATSVFYEEGEKEYLSLKGTVYKKIHTSDYQILYLKSNSIIYYDQMYQESNIIIYDDKFADVKIGNKVYAAGKGASFESAHNPGNFDSKLHYAGQGIYGSVWCENITVLHPGINWIKEPLFQLKKRWNACIVRHMGERQGKVLGAMLTGDKRGMDEEIKALYQKNGLSHILAISGLHISFLGMGIYQMLRKVGASFGISGIIATVMLGAYILLIDAPVSAMRALVMLLLKIGAELSGRVFDMPTAFCVAAAITIGGNPYYLLDAGFLLSYGAIAGILLIVPLLENILPSWCAKIPGLLVSLSVQWMLVPLLLYFYYEVSLLSVFLNLFVIPLMSILLGLGVFGSVLCVAFDAVGGILFCVCRYILLLFECVNGWSVKVPFGSMVIGKPSVLWLVLYYIGLFAVIVLWHLGKKKKRRYGIYMLVLVVGIGAATYIEHNPHGKLQVTCLDVGQGDCIFMRGPDRTTYLVDGGSSDIDKVARYRIIPYLKSQGIRRLDYVFITHGDGDHYSGIEEMLTEKLDVEIKMLVLPIRYENQEALCKLKKKAMARGVLVATINPGERIECAEVSVTCLQPGKKSDIEDSNASSLVLSVAFEEFDMLLTGDVEGEGEELLAKNLRFHQEYDVLKVAHHGSKNSSTEEVLESIRPKVALISAGRNNSYGHPHEETLKRLQKWTSKIYSTSKSGAITIKTDGNAIWITGFH